MQSEITREIRVPSPEGTIAEPGWARSEVMKYAREHIHAPWFRRKEWDYYLFTNQKFGVAFTISDLGYVGLLSVSFIDFVNRTEHTESELAILPMGQKFGLRTEVADAHGECHTKRLDMIFRSEGKNRRIICNFRNFNKETGENLIADLTVYEPDMEAMYICTPWKEKATAFYYNCKKNCLEAEGTVVLGEKTYFMDRETSLGVLDWGRGVWTYDNTWFWGTGSGRINGEPFGFNLGYGFSDRSAASENVIYYRGKVHKLGEVEFRIPEIDGERQYLEPWTITSDDGRFEGTFKPILDRKAKMDFKVIISDQHQVFGRMTGKAVLENGEEVEFRDFLCALEVVRNKY